MPIPLRVVFLGDSTVGKTSILRRLVESQYDDSQYPTIGVDFFSKTLTYQGQQVKVNMWDTAGQERFARVVTPYFRGVDGYIIVFSLVDVLSLNNLFKWFDLIQSANPLASEAIYLVLGNKCDLPDQTRLDHSKVMETINQLKSNYPDLFYLEVSAKSNHHLPLILHHIIEQAMKKRQPVPPLPSSPILTAPPADLTQSAGGCCVGN